MDNGKGDRPRKVEGQKYRDNYDKIFKKKPRKKRKVKKND